MNLLLDEYADNPIIDEVVYWPPKCVQRVVAKESPRGVDVVFEDRNKHFTSFENLDEASFYNWWQEASEILKLVTNIEVIGSEAKADKNFSEKLASELLQRRGELIESCLSKYQAHENDEFAKYWFVEQFGFNCSKLPETIKKVLDNAANT